MAAKEAKARIKINQLLEESGWRFFDDQNGKANIVLEPYEANVKGWLPNKGGKDFVAAHKHFGPMKAADVSFYDETAMLPVTVKRAAQGYGDDDDFDLAYLVGDVSG